MSLPNDLIGQCSADDRQAILKAAWIVAFSDGRLYAEKSKLQQIRAELGVESNAARQVEQEVRDGKAKLSVPGTDAARRVMYHYAVQMTASDGKITPAEQRIALRLGEALELSGKQIRAELIALAPLRADSKKTRGRRKSQAPAQPQSKTLENLLVALGGQEFAQSPVGLFLLTRQSVLVVILTNLIPVIGILFFDWRVFTVVFLYWLENVIVGVFNIAKMIVVATGRRSPGAFVLIPFFAFHYGIFTVGHGVFVFALFGGGQGLGLVDGFLSEFTLGIGVALVSLAAEHAYLFYISFIRTGAYRRLESGLLFFAPYPRIVVLHVSVLFGGMLIMTFEMRSLVLIILIPLKIAIDLLTLSFTEKIQKRGRLL